VLTIIESHPVQYHAPVYRALQAECGIPVTAIYGSDSGAATYHDAEFGVPVAWDTDLLAGYESHFLVRTAEQGAHHLDRLRARGAWQLLRRLAPRAVMLVGYASRFDRGALSAAWCSRLPMIFRAETTDHARSRTPVRARLRDTVLRSLYQSFTSVLYIGQRSLAHYQRLGVPDARLIFSPYCVSTAPFQCDDAARLATRRDARFALGLDDRDIAVLFAGKLSDRKGPGLLVDAVRELPESLRERMCVCFVGDGPLKTELQSDAAIAPAVRARFLGFHNQTGLSHHYHAADVMVLPSRHGETWGLVVNEALHHGVPCIVSDAVGCAPDLIRPGVTGEVFTTGSARSLAVALRASLALVGRADVREHCRQQVSRYSVAEAACGIARAYAQAVRHQAT
jgi:glycosyltransferase involved in cell wall biosynthesis